MLLRRRACAFIDEEAEVSADGACSSDEEDADGEGVLAGLIDDASQPDAPGSAEPARCSAWLDHAGCSPVSTYGKVSLPAWLRLLT